MANNNSKRYQDLHKVLEITRLMATVIDVGELLQLIIDRSMELLDAERASLFLYEPQTNELVSLTPSVETREFKEGIPQDESMARAP